jgi:hypothetical protein
MSDILNKQICLTLNKLHQAYEVRSIRKAVEDITSISPHTGQPPFMFVDIIYEQREDGSYDTEKPITYRAISVDEWMTLPVRSCDLAINCGRCQLRAPTVIIATNFDRLKEIVPQFSGEAVRQREGSRCAVTGRALAVGEGDVGHDIARTHGGKRNWTNTAYVEKGLNRAMGTKTFEEMGWGHVRKKMVAPKPRKVFLTAKDARHESHLLFLNN